MKVQAQDFDLRRRSILDQSARLFAEKGFDGVSAGDLAKACGMSKGLLYYYYESKEEILFDIMISHLNALDQDLTSVTLTDGTPKSKCREFIRRFMQRYVDAADSHKVFLRELIRLPDTKRAKIQTKQRKLADAARHLLIEMNPSLADDPVRAGVDTMLLFGMVNWTHTWFDADGALSTEDLAERILDHMDI